MSISAMGCQGPVSTMVSGPRRGNLCKAGKDVAKRRDEIGSLSSSSVRKKGGDRKAG